MALNQWQIPAGCLQKCKLGSSMAAAHPFIFAPWCERDFDGAAFTVVHSTICDACGARVGAPNCFV
jgi:hypothetical protein